MDPVREKEKKKKKRQNFFGRQRNEGIKELFVITGMKEELIVLNTFNWHLETADFRGGYQHEGQAGEFYHCSFAKGS